MDASLKGTPGVPQKSPVSSSIRRRGRCTAVFQVWEPLEASSIRLRTLLSRRAQAPALRAVLYSIVEEEPRCPLLWRGSNAFPRETITTTGKSGLNASTHQSLECDTKGKMSRELFNTTFLGVKERPHYPWPWWSCHLAPPAIYGR